MKNPGDKVRDSGLSRRAGILITLYLLTVVGVSWLIFHYFLNIRLTGFLARLMTTTGAEWVMYVLLGASILSIGVMLERSLFYRKRFVDIENARQRLDAFLAEGSIEEGRSYFSGLPGMEGQVTAACLGSLDKGAKAMEAKMLATLVEERLKYDRNLIILGTLGNNAPFIGLFGTVLGIIKAFLDLSKNMEQGAAAVMAGISEALVATAIGLLVAIPSVLAFNALKNKVKTAVSNTEFLVRIVTAHSESREPGPPPESGNS